MKIDIHSHTRRHSACSIVSAPELISRTVEAGLDGLVITEHNFTWQDHAVEDLRRALCLPENFFLASGQEVDSDAGHILVYGCDINFGINRHWRDVIRIAEEEGGIAVIAHPFRWKVRFEGMDYDDFLREFSAIEVRSANLNRENQAEGISTARRLKITAVGGSDAHAADMAGTYFTHFPDHMKTMQDLVIAIKAGRVRPGRVKG